MNAAPALPRRFVLKTTLALTLFLTTELILILFIDRPLTAMLRSLETAAPRMIDAFKIITDFGKSSWYLYPSGIGALACLTLAWLTQKHASIMPLPIKPKQLADTGAALASFFTVIAISGLVTDILKFIFGRARPVLDLQNHIYGFQPFTFESVWNSLPSGHATTSIALAASLSMLCPRGRALWLMIGGLLAASRVIVCAHYLSDILAGGFVGTTATNILLRFRDNDGILPLTRRLFPISRPSSLTERNR